MGHNPSDWCLYKTLEHTDSTEKLCKDTVRIWTEANQGKISHKKPNFLALWAWMSSFQNCKKINLPGLSHTVFCYEALTNSYNHYPRLILRIYHCLFSAISLKWKVKFMRFISFIWGFPVAGWSRICLPVLETCNLSLD